MESSCIPWAPIAMTTILAGYLLLKMVYRAHYENLDTALDMLILVMQLRYIKHVWSHRETMSLCRSPF